MRHGRCRVNQIERRLPDRSSAFPPQRLKTGLRARSGRIWRVGKRDRRRSHRPRRPRRRPGDPAARTNSPFARGPADREGCAERDRARDGWRDANRNCSERVRRRRGPGPGIDAPQDLDTFAPSPRDHPGHGRSAATPASNANEGARWFHQSTARRSPLARRTPIRPTQTIESLAVRESKSERSIRMTLSLAFISPVLAEAAMEGRLPRGFCVKRLTDLPMLWSEQWRAVGLQRAIQAHADPSDRRSCYPRTAKS